MDSKNLANADKAAEALKRINVRRIRKLAEFDGDFRAVLDLVNACRKSLSRKRNRMSWLEAAKVLCGKIASYDPLHINFVDKKRKDGTWCMWLTWDAETEIGTMSGYSLISGPANSRIHEEAAKSFVEDFCREGPKCVEIYLEPRTSDRQRRANAPVVKAYKELGSPKTPEEAMDKLARKAQGV